MPRPRRPLPRHPDTGPADPLLLRGAALLGTGGLDRLRKATVLVIGLGGVGSWAAEFLARTGVGTLHIFDPDIVEPSNMNRQRQARRDTVGRPKAEVLAEEITFYEWQRVVPHVLFVDGAALEELVHNLGADAVVEAVDNVTAKAQMIAAARRMGLAYFTALGAGSRLDPTAIRTADLAETSVCPLGKDLRKVLRRKHGFPQEGEGPFGITAVYSLEKPWDSAVPSLRDGSYAPVTAAFGSALASLAIRHIALPADQR